MTMSPWVRLFEEAWKEDRRFAVMHLASLGAKFTDNLDDHFPKAVEVFSCWNASSGSPIWIAQDLVFPDRMAFPEDIECFGKAFFVVKNFGKHGFIR
jgi:hypothetical protein